MIVEMMQMEPQPRLEAQKMQFEHPRDVRSLLNKNTGWVYNNDKFSDINHV